LRCLYPQDQGHTLDLRGDLVMEAVFSDLLAVREQLAAQSALEAQLKQCIQQRMGDASRALFEAGEVSFKRSKDSTGLEVERLLKDRPIGIEPYVVTKPGSRRFVVTAF